MSLGDNSAAPSWAEIEAGLQGLLGEPAGQDPDGFLRGWSAIADRVEEARTGLEFNANADTENHEKAQVLQSFMAGVYLPWQEVEAQLWERLLHDYDSALLPQAMAERARVETPLLPKMGAGPEAGVFVQERSYVRITAGQTILWHGEPTSLRALAPLFTGAKRSERLKAWRLAAERRMEDGAAIGEIWADLVQLRSRWAQRAGYSSYLHMARSSGAHPGPTAHRPFYDAVEEWVSPVLVRLHEERRQRLGGRTLRPWDMSIDLTGIAPVPPPTDLIGTASRLLRRMEPQWADAVDAVGKQGFIDAADRPGMFPGSYAAPLPMEGLAAVMQGTVGDERDVARLFRPLGHALTFIAAIHLPYAPGRYPAPAVREGVGTALQLIASDVRSGELGGPQGAAFCFRQLERFLVDWATAAMLDAFEAWAYDNPDATTDRDECSRRWHDLWLRFLPGVDWTGLDKALEGDWQRHIDLFLRPFAPSDALLGAIAGIGMWSGYRADRERMATRLKEALALGGTRPAEELLSVAGIHLGSDEGAVRDAVEAITDVMDECEREFAGAP